MADPRREVKEGEDVASLRSALARNGYCSVPRSLCSFSTDAAWSELQTRLQLHASTGLHSTGLNVNFMPLTAAAFAHGTEGAAAAQQAPLCHLLTHNVESHPQLIEVRFFHTGAQDITLHPPPHWPGEEPYTPASGQFVPLWAWKEQGRIGGTDLVPVAFHWDGTRHTAHIGCQCCTGNAAFWALPGAVLTPASPEALAAHFAGSRHAGQWGIYASEMGRAEERAALLQLAGALVGEGSGGVTDAFRPCRGRTFNEYFPVTFPTAGAPLPVQPCNFEGGTGSQNWHCDYHEEDRHDFAAGTRHGLVAIVLLTDCDPVTGGGTLLVPGSHHWVREHLRERAATTHKELVGHFSGQLSAYFNARAAGEQGMTVRITEHLAAPPLALPGEVAVAGALQLAQVSGKKGDVWLMHPWLLHTGSLNKGNCVRAITNFTLRTANALQL